MTDPFVPWIPLQEPDFMLTGPLAGLRLAVKDLFDVAGMPTGAGNPRWLETHPAAADADAEAVARLRGAGASLIGKTVTDELAWSLNGTNAHYGTPENPAAPGRMPGGSSSGSASAVALGAADVGLGTDTGGSIRLPASYCGLFGLRPSHGRVPLEGVVPLSPSFDTAGALARDARTLREACEVLLGTSSDAPEPFTGVLAPRDVWDEASPEARRALEPAVDRLGLEIDTAPLFDEPDGLERARVAYAMIQAFEAWRSHGEWIEKAEPEFGPGVAARFSRAADVSAETEAEATRHRDRVTELLSERLSGGAVLAIPAAPGPAPEPEASIDREAVVRLTCLAGLTRAPALALPSGDVAGLPVGLQLVGSPGDDEALLALGEAAGPGRRSADQA
ncbi:amidase [Glycomyces xiaoerkulensis]|uniref:amidase n=1 Tax=Glycomyces xiaoerkulensis TaxID=2038139 RepID=UPI0018E45DA6|nr:amidase [Glycomyces xiaoerkulensis]